MRDTNIYHHVPYLFASKLWFCECCWYVSFVLFGKACTVMPIKVLNLVSSFNIHAARYPCKLWDREIPGDINTMAFDGLTPSIMYEKQILVFNDDGFWLYKHTRPSVYVFLKHDDVIKWKHFPRYWTFVMGIHRSPVDSPYKRQWRGVFNVSFELRLNKRLRVIWNATALLITSLRWSNSPQKSLDYAWYPGYKQLSPCLSHKLQSLKPGLKPFSCFNCYQRLGFCMFRVKRFFNYLFNNAKPSSRFSRKWEL